MRADFGEGGPTNGWTHTDGQTNGQMKFPIFYRILSPLGLRAKNVNILAGSVMQKQPVNFKIAKCYRQTGQLAFS